MRRGWVRVLLLGNEVPSLFSFPKDPPVLLRYGRGIPRGRPWVRQSEARNQGLRLGSGSGCDSGPHCRLEPATRKRVCSLEKCPQRGPPGGAGQEGARSWFPAPPSPERGPELAVGQTARHRPTRAMAGPKRSVGTSFARERGWDPAGTYCRRVWHCR